MATLAGHSGRTTLSKRVETQQSLADPGSFAPEDLDLQSVDPLGFEGYSDALRHARERSGVDESVQAGRATIGGIEVQLAEFEFSFLGGSMGEVAGERLTRALEVAARRHVPFVLRTATGGARMQEGMRSLVQMPKVVVARRELAEQHQPFVAVLGHPTTGGVLASIGALADVTIAEADATIGFAGPRVVERLSGAPVPSGSHTANSAYAHGLVDELVPKTDAHAFVASLLKLLAPDDPEEVEVPPPLEHSALEDAWEAVEAARSPARPLATELIGEVCDLFVELRGDRGGTDDPSVRVGLGRIAGRRAMLVALDRNLAPGPSAYRKAKRCVRIASDLLLPVVTLVDTRGADPTPDSEARGIAWEIASLFEAMLGIDSPVLSVVTGEGGSGGALAFAVADELVVFHDAIFSVIAPEAAAEILWRSPTRAPDAARALRLTASGLYELGIADWVVDATLGSDSVRFVIADALDRLTHDGTQDFSARRRARWRAGP
ncbi:MAG: acetyl-CoA carboxylase carboxyltransferase subunit alpha/beta [Actinomycetota bacterium]|nr:acetyl-CoA carboxylase carboxyltransferase subunit alpha/beta [Actinomycetota bacterium]